MRCADISEKPPASSVNIDDTPLLISDAGSIQFLWSVGKFLPDYTASNPRRQQPSESLPWATWLYMDVDKDFVPRFSVWTLVLKLIPNYRKFLKRYEPKDVPLYNFLW
jgi:hypothetical protein